MPLWTDGLYPSPGDVAAVAPDLATDNSYDQSPTTLLNLCTEAYSHCAGILASKLQSVIGATNFNPSGGATALHNSAIIWGIRAQTQVVKLRLGQMVLNDLYTGDTGVSLNGPIRDWLAYWAVTLGYRKLMGQSDPKSDRYLLKYQFYRKLVGNEKWNILAATGIPYVRLPLPAPGALFEPSAGRWTTANLSQVVPGAGSPAGGTFYVAITWVAQAASNGSGLYVSQAHKGNAESGPSQIMPLQNSIYPSLVVTAGHVLTISIASLNPPTGAVPLPEASVTGVTTGTMIATGWNIYVGLGAGGNPPTDLYLQNATPLPLTTTSYSLPANPVLTGYRLGPGQYPDANMGIPNNWMRT